MMPVCALHRLDAGLHSQLPAAPACSGTYIWHRAQSCPNLSLPPVCEPSSTSCSGAGTCMCPERQPPSAVQRPVCPVLQSGLAQPWASRQSAALCLAWLALLLCCGGASGPRQPWQLSHLQTSFPKGGGPTSFPQSCGSCWQHPWSKRGHVAPPVEGLGLLPPCQLCHEIAEMRQGLPLLPVTQAGTVPSPGGPAPLNRVAGPILVVGGSQDIRLGGPIRSLSVRFSRREGCQVIRR